MPAFTVFALGSGQRYDKDNPDEKKNENVNTDLYKGCGEPKLILDGPQKFGGAYDPKKIDENVEEIIKQFQLVAERDPPESGKYIINMSGFSRGSVTCIRAANKLEEMARQGKLFDKNNQPISVNDLEVNMALEDPVAGPSDKSDPNYKNIPSVVKNLVITLQTDERRRAYKCQDMSRLIIADQTQTTTTFLPLYGNHSTANKLKGDPTIEQCAHIHKDFKKQFLRQCGTVSSDKTQMSPEQLLQSYDIAQQNRPDYKRKAQVFQYKDIPIPGIARTFNSHLEDYVIDHSFFVNQHHRELVKQQFPVIFNWCFEHGKLDPSNQNTTGGGYDAEAVAKEIARMKITLPTLFKQLVDDKRIVIRNSALISSNYDPPEAYGLSPTAHGAHRIERCKFTNFLENKKIIKLTPSEELENDVVSAVYQYGRNKSELAAFSYRTENKRSLEIKHETHKIMNGPKSDDEKQKAIISLLEEHTKELLSMNSKSKLLVSLKGILEKQGYKFDKEPIKHITATGYIGLGVRAIGSAVQFLGKGVGIIVGGIGQGIHDLGTRMTEQKNTGLKLIGAGISFLGAGIITVGTALDTTGDWLKLQGNNIIKNSSSYTASFTVGNVVTIPEENKKPISSQGAILVGLNAETEAEVNAEAKAKAKIKAQQPLAASQSEPRISPATVNKQERVTADAATLSGNPTAGASTNNSTRAPKR